MMSQEVGSSARNGTGTNPVTADTSPHVNYLSRARPSAVPEDKTSADDRRLCYFEINDIASPACRNTRHSGTIWNHQVVKLLLFSSCRGGETADAVDSKSKRMSHGHLTMSN